MNNQQTPEVISITSLSQLGPQDVTIRIILADERVLEIPCREMTWARMAEIERSVPETIGDVSAAMEIGKTGYYPRKDHPAYQAGLAAANRKRLLLKLAEFVRFDVPGDSLDERAAALEATLTPDIVDGLTRALNQMSQAQLGRAQERAESFRSQRPAADRSGKAQSPGGNRAVRATGGE